MGGIQQVHRRRERRPGHGDALRIHARLSGAPQARRRVVRKGAVFLPARKRFDGRHRAVVLLVLRLRQRSRRRRRRLHGGAVHGQTDGSTSPVRHRAKRARTRDD